MCCFSSGVKRFGALWKSQRGIVVVDGLVDGLGDARLEERYPS